MKAKDTDYRRETQVKGKERKAQVSHFHAERGDNTAEVGIDPIVILEGGLPRSMRANVFEWAAIHQAELHANWELARAGLPLLAIEPLD